MKKYIILALAVGLSLLLVSKLSAQDPMDFGPGTYEILDDNGDPIRIPFRMHKGKPVMDVEINHHKAALMIDNGVLWNEVWLFGTPLVNKLDLKPVEEASLHGAGEGDATSIFLASSNLKIKFDDIVFYEQPVYVSPIEAGFGRMFPGTDGQLCNTFFKHFIVEFDFINNYVILHLPDKFEPYKDGSVIPMTLNPSGTHAVPFEIETVNGIVLKDKTDIDFGGIYSFKASLGNDNGIELPEEKEEIIGFGAQGKITSYKGKLNSMTFGKYKFKNPSIMFGDAKTARVFPENLGVIGLPMFMKFNIAFDYFNNKIYIEPNENFDGEIIE